MWLSHSLFKQTAHICSPIPFQCANSSAVSITNPRFTQILPFMKYFALLDDFRRADDYFYFRATETTSLKVSMRRWRPICWRTGLPFPGLEEQVCYSILVVIHGVILLLAGSMTSRGSSSREPMARQSSLSTASGSNEEMIESLAQASVSNNAQ